MQYDTKTFGDQISVFLSQLDLPTDDEDREQLLDDLEVAVEAVLADHGLDENRVKLIGGHVYASVESNCPVCGDQLGMIEPALDASNGAVATASCTCGWHGEAVYRLIDLREPPSGDLDDGDTTIHDFEENSHVRRADIRPQYYPY